MSLSVSFAKSIFSLLSAADKQLNRQSLISLSDFERLFFAFVSIYIFFCKDKAFLNSRQYFFVFFTLQNFQWRLVGIVLPIIFYTAFNRPYLFHLASAKHCPLQYPLSIVNCSFLLPLPSDSDHTGFRLSVRRCSQGRDIIQ